MGGQLCTVFSNGPKAPPCARPAVVIRPVGENGWYTGRCASHVLGLETQESGGSLPAAPDLPSTGPGAKKAAQPPDSDKGGGS